MFTTIKNEVKNMSPIWSDTIVRNRGVPLYVDPVLSGSARFGQKVGSDIAMLTTNTYGKVTGVIDARTIQVDVFPPDLSIGSIIGFDENTEVAQVSDMIASQNLIVLASNLVMTDHKTFMVWAKPVAWGDSQNGTSLPPYAASATTIFVVSPFHVTANDVLVIRTDTFANPAVSLSTFLVQISSAQILSETGGSFWYRLTLSKPLPFTVTQNHLVYLRTDPSYLSGYILVDKSKGPFLLDHQSGPLYSGSTEVVEDFEILNYSGRKTFLSRHPYQKNSIFYQVDIGANLLLFWGVWSGSSAYVRNTDQYVARCSTTSTQYSDDGSIRYIWGIKTPIWPNIVASDGVWSSTVVSNNPAKLILRCGSVTTTYTLVPGIPQPIFLGSQTSNTIDYISMFATSMVPGTELLLGGFKFTGQVVTYLRYSMSARNTHHLSWVGSGLICKPIFFGLDSLKIVYDQNYHYDSSGLYLG